jgi:hypothetical protein
LRMFTVYRFDYHCLFINSPPDNYNGISLADRIS